MGRRGNVLVFVLLVTILVMSGVFVHWSLVVGERHDTAAVARELRAIAIGDGVADTLDSLVQRQAWSRRFYIPRRPDGPLVGSDPSASFSTVFTNEGPPFHLVDGPWKTGELAFQGVIKDLDPARRIYRIYVEVDCLGYRCSLSYDRRHRESLVGSLNRGDRVFTRSLGPIDLPADGSMDGKLDRIKTFAMDPSRQGEAFGGDGAMLASAMVDLSGVDGLASEVLDPAWLLDDEAFDTVGAKLARLGDLATLPRRTQPPEGVPGNEPGVGPEPGGVGPAPGGVGPEPGGTLIPGGLPPGMELPGQGTDPGGDAPDTTAGQEYSKAMAAAKHCTNLQGYLTDLRAAVLDMVGGLTAIPAVQAGVDRMQAWHDKVSALADQAAAASDRAKQCLTMLHVSNGPETSRQLLEDMIAARKEAEDCTAKALDHIQGAREDAAEIGVDFPAPPAE